MTACSVTYAWKTLQVVMSSGRCIAAAGLQLCLSKGSVFATLAADDSLLGRTCVLALSSQS